MRILSGVGFLRWDYCSVVILSMEVLSAGVFVRGGFVR